MDFPSLLPQNYSSLLPANVKVDSSAQHSPASSDLLQREIGVPAAPGGFFGRIERVLNWLEGAYWRQVIKSREAYLAKSQNLPDLENRIKELDSNAFLRWRSMP
jgi:hypothetical protein